MCHCPNTYEYRESQGITEDTPKNELKRQMAIFFCESQSAIDILSFSGEEKLVRSKRRYGLILYYILLKHVKKGHQS